MFKIPEIKLVKETWHHFSKTFISELLYDHLIIYKIEFIIRRFA